MDVKPLLKIVQVPNKPCIHPWFYLWINAAGDATVCPQNKIRLGSLENYSIDEIWNSAKLKQIRENFLNEEYEAAGCEKECPYLRGIYKHASENIPDEELIFPSIDLNKLKENSISHKNLIQAIKEYDLKLLDVNSSPSVFDCQNILTCNASCIMCGQPHASKLKHSTMVKDKILAASRKLSSIRWQGGEVFADKNFIADFEKISTYGHDNLLKIIITNGSLLKQNAIDALFAMGENLKFIISMDGATKTTFEKIRYKLKYEKVFATVINLAKKQKSLQKNNMVLWNYTVMKSNITEVGDAIKIASELGININFAAIQGEFPGENFFEYELLDINDWSKYLQQWNELIKGSTIKVSGFKGLTHRYRFK